MTKVSVIARLRSQGFDESRHIPGTRRWRIRCSQCQACSINGVPCHEQRCPNIPRDTDEED